LLPPNSLQSQHRPPLPSSKSASPQIHEHGRTLVGDRKIQVAFLNLYQPVPTAGGRRAGESSQLFEFRTDLLHHHGPRFSISYVQRGLYPSVLGPSILHVSDQNRNTAIGHNQMYFPPRTYLETGGP
jgi:hypothetical protein